MERWGIAISDLHSGSSWGLRAPSWTQPGSGDTLLAGTLATTLHEEYQQLVKRF